MNILELQLRVAISGVPERGSSPTLLDWTGPVCELLSAVPPDLSATPDPSEPDPGWTDLTYRQL